MTPAPIAQIAQIARLNHSKHAARERGFTLIELLVAMTAGLFVAIGAVALAKQGSRFFQQETRVANAQFAVTLGFDRLRSDIARAGFLSTPNIQRDPFRCGTVTGWPAGMARLAALRLNKTTPSAAQDTLNGLTPDQIILAGSYASVETFPVRTVVLEDAKYNVYLQANTGALTRTSNGGVDSGSLGQLFKSGRMMRILDTTGHYEYGAIDSYAVNASGQMVVSVKPAPALAFRKDGGTCGIEGLGVGMQANVISFIQYDVRNLKAAALPQYAPLYNAAATAPGDDTRLDLVRVELDTAGAEMADTLELVTEYAVDLRFGLTVQTSLTPTGDPDMTSYPIGNATNYDYSFDVSTKTTIPGPERIRAVRARLVVRSREADRIENIAATTAGNIFRYAVGPDAGFARARTLTADIQLPNLAGITW